MASISTMTDMNKLYDMNIYNFDSMEFMKGKETDLVEEYYKDMFIERLNQVVPNIMNLPMESYMDKYKNLSVDEINDILKRNFFEYMDTLRSIDRWTFDNKNAYRKQDKIALCKRYFRIITHTEKEWMNAWEISRLGYLTPWP